jgi:tetratricopeptide (TPR) repeat protein
VACALSCAFAAAASARDTLGAAATSPASELASEPDAEVTTPSHFGGLKNLAVLYQQAGFRNKAVEAWERALCVAPDAATRSAIKEHIVSLL